jgi:hypothetical protein
VSWLETESDHFSARHDEQDAEGAVQVLELLEAARDRVAGRFPARPDEPVDVVLHGALAQLHAAQPLLPVITRLTTPASRRYLAGWPAGGTIHVLAPRLLAERASGVEGSREMLLLTPAALYVRLVAAASNPKLRVGRRDVRWGWLGWGVAQHFSGQTTRARPAIVRRLREGPPPAFPPAVRDAHLLGGTVIDLLVREEGEQAVIDLATGELRTPREALERAFHGRSLRHTEGTWRAHLSRLAGRA